MTRDKTERISLLTYFSLCFALAWAVWIPLGMYAPQNYFLILIGAFAPTISAILVTGCNEGKKGVRKLLSTLLLWRVKISNYLIAVFGLLSIVLLAIAINSLFFNGSWITTTVLAERFGLPEDDPVLFFLLTPLVFLATFIGGPIAEELGWRGYAQPRLQKQIGPEISGFVIGLTWSLWHLPLFYFFPNAVAELPLGYYIPMVSAFGIFFAWLYNRAKGSVLLCIIFHTGVNFALGVFSAGFNQTDYTLLNIFLALLIMLAIFLVPRIKKWENQ